jgi:hypothetical protein
MTATGRCGRKGGLFVKLYRLFLISALAAVLAACADQPTTTSVEADSPEIFAIGRYVLPTNRFRDLYEHVGSNGPSGIKYDSEFRHPHLPIGGLVVDCELTHRIGVTLAVANPADKKSGTSTDELHGGTWAKRLKVKYHWSHSTAEELGFSQYVIPSSYGSWGSDNILSDGMTLTKKNRIDGVWTVAVTHNDDTIYQTDFQLVGCPSGSS